MESKPSIHIDTSVFLAILFQEKKKELACRDYLFSMKKNYELKISSVALGEIIKAIFKYKDFAVRQKAFFYLDKLIISLDLEIYTPTYKAYESINKIRKISHFIESMDALLFTNAIDDSANLFVTIDKDFDKKLESEFKIKVKQLT